MRFPVSGPDFRAVHADLEDDIAAALTGAIDEETDDLKADWRAQIERAGLGRKLANTVRARTYPSMAHSLDPAGWVWTKAPLIVDAFDRGTPIYPTDGRFYMAIPSRNVPRVGRRLMTPLEVETSYNQDLIIRRSRSGHLTAWVDAAVRTFTRGQGAAYGKRKAVRIGKPKLVFMFTLVRSVKLPKRLDLDALGRASEARYPATLARHWAAMPDRTAPIRRR